MDDELIILNGLKEGNPGAVYKFYDWCKPILLNYITSLIPNPMDAEDLFSEVVEDFLDNEKYLLIESNLKGYLATAIKNKGIKFIRAQKRRRLRHYKYFENQHPTGKYYTEILRDAEEEQKEQQLALVIEAMNTLPVKSKEILTMRYLENKKPASIAIEKKYNLEAVNKQLSRSVKRIKKVLGIPMK